jgi:hypothetical protein
MGLLLRIGDRNVRNYREFTAQLHYPHRNPVKRGLVLKLLLVFFVGAFPNARPLRIAPG